MSIRYKQIDIKLNSNRHQFEVKSRSIATGLVGEWVEKVGANLHDGLRIQADENLVEKN